MCEGEGQNIMPGEMMRREKGGEFSYPRRCVGVGVEQRARVRDERGRPEWWETAEIESDLESRADGCIGLFKGVAKEGERDLLSLTPKRVRGEIAGTTSISFLRSMRFAARTAS